MRNVVPFVAFAALAAVAGCAGAPSAAKSAPVRLITLDPGHFHAALVQNRSYAGVDPVVHVYAPKGPDVEAHLKLIAAFNARTNDPTAWREEVYTGDDYLDRMLVERAGNVVVLAGRNNRKTDYILKCVTAGYNVFSDKPMAITPDGYAKLEKAFAAAAAKGVLLYDIMTERFEITTRLQRELTRFPALYGAQEKGSPSDPAVTKLSVHHFCKLVNGQPLRRPAWYYDTDQQGEAIMDVTTHLTDLVQWETFPEVSLSTGDVRMVSAKVWPTAITAADYEKSTGMKSWPDYLKKDVDAKGVLQCRANGEFTYALKGVYAKVSVLWNFMPPAGGGDTHYSLMRGTKASLEIHQGAAEGYRPRLYVRPRPGVDKAATEAALRRALAALAKDYPGLGFHADAAGWVVDVPKSYDIGHEAHFSQVTRNFLKYLAAGRLPAWERANMLVKYYTLREAYRAAHGLK